MLPMQSRFLYSKPCTQSPGYTACMHASSTTVLIASDCIVVLCYAIPLPPSLTRGKWLYTIMITIFRLFSHNCRAVMLSRHSLVLTGDHTAASSLSSHLLWILPSFVPNPASSWHTYNAQCHRMIIWIIWVSIVTHLSHLIISLCPPPPSAQPMK